MWVASIFFFSHNIFERLLFGSCQNFSDKDNQFLSGNINLEVYITDFTSAKEEHNSSLNRFLLMTGNLGQNATCSIDNATAVQLQPDNVAGILSSVLKSMYKCDLRAKMDKVWTFLIRFASRSLPDMFVQEYNSGEMTQKIHEEFVTHFDGCNASFAKVQFEFILPTSKIGVYKDVHLSFQGKLIFYRIIVFNPKSNQIDFQRCNKGFMTPHKSRAKKFCCLVNS